METHHLPDIRHRAIKIHFELSEKHASFIHSRYGDCAKVAFSYQQAQSCASKTKIQGKVEVVVVSFGLLLKLKSNSISSFANYFGRWICYRKTRGNASASLYYSIGQESQEERFAIDTFAIL